MCHDNLLDITSKYKFGKMHVLSMSTCSFL